MQIMWFKCGFEFEELLSIRLMKIKAHQKNTKTENGE